MTAEQWKADVEPYVQCVLEQLPVSAYLRQPRAPEETPMPGTADIGIPLSARAVVGLASSVPAGGIPLGQVVEEMLPPTASAALDAISQADAKKDQTVLALTVEQDALPAAGEPKVRALIAALDTLVAKQQFLAYAFVHERPLMQCAPRLQLLLLLPVGETLDDAMFPRQ